MTIKVSIISSYRPFNIINSIPKSCFIKNIKNGVESHNRYKVIFCSFFWSTLGSHFHDVYSHHVNNKIIYFYFYSSQSVVKSLWRAYPLHWNFSILLGFRALHNGKFLNTINWIRHDRTTWIQLITPLINKIP
jgi:hypothetical protein